jgi:hypothetical protein
MDELILPVAAVAALATLATPARRRVVPVVRAVGHVGVSVVGATVVGGRGIVDAAIRGESATDAQRTGDSRRRPRGRSSGSS